MIFKNLFRQWRVEIVVQSERINKCFDNFDYDTATACFVDLAKGLYEDNCQDGQITLYWRWCVGSLHGDWKTFKHVQK